MRDVDGAWLGEPERVGWHSPPGLHASPKHERQATITCTFELGRMISVGHPGGQIWLSLGQLLTMSINVGPILVEIGPSLGRNRRFAPSLRPPLAMSGHVSY